MILNSVEDLMQFWKSLWLSWTSNVLLYWDLWAWKTHFTKWFAEWIWLNKNLIQSPTYTYLNEYEDKLLHIDMYRLNEEIELIEKWILDKINEYSFICIEWPKFENLYFNNDFVKIEILKISENSRKINFL